ncbi:MAG: hypothetical protein RL693_2836 [Verrucomicrobiota bacterium]|jgi:PIN domain nuclease of toxin-antitoxin system
MNLLLDTHAALWLVSAPEKMSAPALKAFRTSGEVFLSIASLWELANKIAIGKLELSSGWSQRLPDALAKDGVRLLGVTPEDCNRLSTLPMHHRDPFDRMMVAQALQRDLALVSVDAELKLYGVKVVW